MFITHFIYSEFKIFISTALKKKIGSKSVVTCLKIYLYTKYYNWETESMMGEISKERDTIAFPAIEDLWCIGGDASGGEGSRLRYRSDMARGLRPSTKISIAGASEGGRGLLYDTFPSPLSGAPVKAPRLYLTKHRTRVVAGYLNHAGQQSQGLVKHNVKVSLVGPGEAQSRRNISIRVRERLPLHFRPIL